MTDTRSVIDEASIRRRAFELWQSRGCPMGSPEDDWFTAMRSFEASGDPVRPTAPTSSPQPSVRDEAFALQSAYTDAAGSLPLGLRIVSSP